MHIFRRKYQCKRPFNDQPEPQDSIHDEEIVLNFEQDHEDLEGFEQINSADPDSGPPSSNGQMGRFIPGYGWVPYNGGM